MTKIDARHYTYRVIWSEEDQEFIGLCAEFPSLSHLDEDQSSFWPHQRHPSADLGSCGLDPTGSFAD